MKIYYNPSYYFAVFLISLFTLHPTAVSEPIPNGLCILHTEEGGYAHGFVIGDLLFSSAHVLKLPLKSIFCTNNGQMRNITQQWNGKLTIPPAYFDPSEYLSQVSKVQPNNELRKSAELIISKLHDIGILQLSNVQESDFLLNPAITISEMIEIENDLEARKEELFLFESAISFTSSKKLSDLSAHKVAFDSQFMLSINFQNVEDEIDMLLDDELSVGPGSSGAPIVHRVEGNQFLVLGIVTGNFPWVEVEKDGKIIHPTIYLPVSPLLPHLADRQDLFYRNAVPACRTLTRITTERRYVKK